MVTAMFWTLFREHLFQTLFRTVSQRSPLWHPVARKPKFNSKRHKNETLAGVAGWMAVLVLQIFWNSTFTNSGKNLLNVDLIYRILANFASTSFRYSIRKFCKFLPEFEEVDFQQICGTSTTDSTFTCQAGSTRSNVTTGQVSNPPLPTLHCLHRGCPEGEPAVTHIHTVYTPIGVYHLGGQVLAQK